jgi:hypothetical protein
MVAFDNAPTNSFLSGNFGTAALSLRTTAEAEPRGGDQISMGYIHD